MTDEAFDQLCQSNPDAKFERTANGELVIMSPVGGEGGKREADLIINLGLWNRQTNLGVVFSSSPMEPIVPLMVRGSSRNNGMRSHPLNNADFHLLPQILSWNSRLNQMI